MQEERNVISNFYFPKVSYFQTLYQPNCLQKPHYSYSQDQDITEIEAFT